MPIHPSLRHYYSSEAWFEARDRILRRAGRDRSFYPPKQARCEWCNKPDCTTIVTAEGGFYMEHLEGGWRDRTGQRCEEPPGRKWSCFVILTIAHLNRIPGDNRDENLVAICQACHLRYDREQHVLNRKRTLRAKLNNLELPLEAPAKAG